MSEEYKSSRELLLNKLRQSQRRNQMNFGYFHRERFYKEQIRNFYNEDKEIILEAIKHNNSHYIYASNRLRNDKEIISEFLSKESCDPTTFSALPEELQKSREFNLKLSKQHPSFFRYFHPEFKNDKEILIEVIKTNEKNYIYASKQLKHDKEIILKCIKRKSISELVKEIPLIMKNDEEIAMKIIDVLPSYFKNSSKELQNNKTIAKKAIQRNALNYKYCSEDLKNDEDLFFQSILSKDLTFHPFQAAPEKFIQKLMSNQSTIIKILKYSSYFHSKAVFQYIPVELFDIKEILFAALKTFPLKVRTFITEDFLNNKQNVLEMVSINGFTYSFILDDHLKKDGNIILQALKLKDINYDHVFKFLPEEMKNMKPLLKLDSEIVGRALSLLPVSFLHASRFFDDRNIILQMISKRPTFLSGLLSKYKKDEEIIMIATKKDGTVFSNADESLKGSKSFIIQALNQKRNIFNSISNELKSDKQIILTAIQNGFFSSKFPQEIVFNDEEIFLELLIYSPILIQRLNNIKNSISKYQNDRDFIMKAIRRKFHFRQRDTLVILWISSIDS
eukprot:gene8242-67_t